LSVDELALVEGFDAALVEALRPYVSVLPLRADGINVNTAPPWVLALLYTGTSGAYAFVEEEDVRRILETRESGALFCADEANQAGCTPVREVLPDTVYPPLSFTSDVFYVRAEAQYGSAIRSVDAVVDRRNPAQPALLAIRVH
jgi:general secretion pathway protein K